MLLSGKETRKLRQIENDNNAYLKQLDRFSQGKLKHFDTINLGNAFNLFEMLHIPTTELVVAQSVISNSLMSEDQGNANHSQGHDLDYVILKEIPDSIRNPILVINGKFPDTIVVVTELLNKENSNIIIPISLNQRGIKSSVNKITTIFSKKHLLNYLNRFQNDILAYNKEKAEKLFTTIGCQLPKTTSAICYDNSITYSLANVKYPEEKNLQENQKNKGDVKPMTEQQMLAQIEALRKEFEGKFSAMEEKFNNLSSEVQTINKFVAAMTEAQGFEQTMSEIESVTKQLTGCENAVFCCYDNGADKFFSGSGDERNYEQAADNIRAAFDSGEIISSGQAAVIPLVSAKGETLGVIAAEKEGGFTAADYDYFKSGSQIVSTVELALNKEFEHQGRVTDELTGLKNRQGLNEYVADTVRRNINADKPVNIVMCDIDHFKNINDTYGHDAGDTVLKNVAKIMQDGTRSGDDCAFRMGGEEMVLMLGCEPDKAAEIAERLRAEVENAVHTVMQDGQEKEISVTISMGIHTMKPETEMTKENARAVFDSEFKFADDLVYEAKESGRNRVVTDISETVIELDGYISDDIPVYDIDRNEDIKTSPETVNDSILADSSVQENITFEGLNEAYNDFLYSSKIFNDVHISFTDEHGELPPDLSTAENRAAVSEYINNQLDSGNITAEQREELTNLRQKIRDFEEPLFCEVVDEIMEQAAEISEISQETREQETEKSKGNER